MGCDSLFKVVVSYNKSKRIMLQIGRVVVIWIRQGQREYIIYRERWNSFPNCDTPWISSKG
jgi:hypothetical protein